MVDPVAQPPAETPLKVWLGDGVVVDTRLSEIQANGAVVALTPAVARLLATLGAQAGQTVALDTLCCVMAQRKGFTPASLPSLRNSTCDARAALAQVLPGASLRTVRRTGLMLVLQPRPSAAGAAA
jgi:DNA-binding winged helix-turn-helix (wHTH) protein